MRRRRIESACGELASSESPLEAIFIRRPGFQEVLIVLCRQRRELYRALKVQHSFGKHEAVV